MTVLEPFIRTIHLQVATASEPGEDQSCPNPFTIQKLPSVNNKANKHLVFIQGWGSDCRIFSSIINHSALNDFHIFLVDLPGFGVNNGQPKLALQPLLDLCLQTLPAEAYYIGWSLGGMLATHLASHHPDRVKGLVCLGSNSRFVTSSDWSHGMNKDVFERFRQDFIEDPNAALQTFRFLQTQGHHESRQLAKTLKAQFFPPEPSQHEAWLYALDLLVEIDNRQVVNTPVKPMLHIFAEQDALVPHDSGRALLSSLENNKTAQEYCLNVETVPQCGHLFILTHATFLAERIAQFVKHCGMSKSKLSIGQSFSDAASSYDQFSLWQFEEGQKLLAKVAEKVVSSPTPLNTVVDLGCGSGKLSQKVEQCLKPERLICLDLASGMLELAQQRSLKANTESMFYVQGDIDLIPLTDNTADLVFSNLALQWSTNLPQFFAELYRALKPGAYAYINTLGESTLAELKAAFAKVDDYIHVNNFDSADNVVTLAKNSGLFVEESTCTIRKNWYEDALALMNELKGIGAHNLNADRPRGLLTKSKINRIDRYMRDGATEKYKGVSACYEVLTLVLRKSESMHT